MGKQAKVIALPTHGHAVVLGTAGSGKTTIALLRAQHLANLHNGGKVLVVTFNGALVKYMHHIISDPPDNLVIENYHKFARGYLSSRKKMPQRNAIVSSDQKVDYIKQARDLLLQNYPEKSIFERPIEFFVEEISFMEKFGLLTLEKYTRAERIGHASSHIKRNERTYIFDVYKKYIELRETYGHKYDWDDLAFYVFEELKNDDSERRYTHIIVDEGQDFSPMMIKSLMAAVADGGSFTFFGDVAQQIYGSRLSWRDSGINTQKIWRFDANYRNPKTITEFAKAITQNRYWQHSEDMVEATYQIAEGPTPILVRFLDKQREIDWVVKHAISNRKAASIVVICRNRADIDIFLQAFEDNGCHAIEIDKDTPGFAHSHKIYLSTYHAAKGLEFDHVFIPHITQDKLPDHEIVSKATSKSQAYADEIKLLYVAATRSKQGLYMTYCGELSPLFPCESNSYKYYNEEEEADLP